MTDNLRAGLVVTTLGLAMCVAGVVAPGEWGRAFTGGGMVFTTIGLALIAVTAAHSALRARPVGDRRHGP